MTFTRRRFLNLIIAVTPLSLGRHFSACERSWPEIFWRRFEERFLGDWPFRDPWHDPLA